MKPILSWPTHEVHLSTSAPTTIRRPLGPHPQARPRRRHKWVGDAVDRGVWIGLAVSMLLTLAIGFLLLAGVVVLVVKLVGAIRG